MKKLLSMILIVLLVTAMAVSLAACKEELPDNSQQGVNVTFIVIDTDGTELYNKKLETKRAALADSFVEFEGLNVKGSNSYLGLFITSVEIGEIKLIKDDVWGDYEGFVADITLSPEYPVVFALYHDIDDIKYKDIPEKTREFDGKTYYYSGVGVSLLPLLDGATYILTLETYGG